MLRSLRIAAAVFFALLAIGFMALWVRSHRRYDVLLVDVGEVYVAIDSHKGSTLYYISATVSSLTWPSFAHGSSLSQSPPKLDGGWAGFDYQSWPLSYTWAVLLPDWFLAACSLALAALFALKRTWRFSVRTALTATTLVAAALGLGVYLIR